jgi:hypothetical protein
VTIRGPGVSRVPDLPLGQGYLSLSDSGTPNGSLVLLLK